MHLPLHFATAGAFFTFAAVCIVIMTYYDFKYQTCEDKKGKCRRGARLASAAMMGAGLVSLLCTMFTYPEIKKFDRRPTVIWGELLGIAGFLVFCLSLIPPFLDDFEDVVGKGRGRWEKKESDGSRMLQEDEVASNQL
jgi:hypothetical protein